MTENLGNRSQISRFIHAIECLDDGIHDFVQRELGLRPVSLRNGKVFNLHCIVCYCLCLFLPTEVIRFGKLFLLSSLKSYPFWKTVIGCKGTKIPLTVKQYNLKKN
jgi:hypothetical protein